MSDHPVTVAVQGWTWSAGLLATLNAVVIGVAVALVKAWPALKKIAADREGLAAKTSNEREANLLQERAEEMEIMRDRIGMLEAERQIDRHRINNLTQCLDALLLLIEQDPTKAAAAAARIRDMRAAQLVAEAAEKGAAVAPKIQGATI